MYREPSKKVSVILSIVFIVIGVGIIFLGLNNQKQSEIIKDTYAKTTGYVIDYYEYYDSDDDLMFRNIY